MIKKHCRQKKAGHINRDSAAIKSREKPVKTPKASPKLKRKRGRPRKGQMLLKISVSSLRPARQYIFARHRAVFAKNSWIDHFLKVGSGRFEIG